MLLKVQTRHHTTTKTLGTFNYTYTEMRWWGRMEPRAASPCPSPQIRAIFAPPARSRVRSGHYVTGQRNRGIVAFHAFNFILNLRMYGDFDTCNDDNAGQQVSLRSVQPAEMLYAFVFSTEWWPGTAARCRSPVTSRFNEMRDTLFATPCASLSKRQRDQLDRLLGGDFAAVGTVALYRT